MSIYSYSRAVVASSDYPEASKFAELLKNKTAGVKFDEKTGHGSANLGFGEITWNEGSNNDTIHVTLLLKKFVAPGADEATDAIVAIRKAISTL